MLFFCSKKLAPITLNLHAAFYPCVKVSVYQFVKLTFIQFFALMPIFLKSAPYSEISPARFVAVAFTCSLLPGV